ncbi:hypothetical protein [Corallococcus llansteffanensis]|uniref:Uncharacterized protein n=1 Tax=Corallococcus llansteffanensis TaxID=2316731 RepID=A0A3A8QLT4_9BACT|nr:hypothetical protein [Corallococcus llansteffanensis]RKH68768.1 hypothetical protein D7V93_00830 [Corallococcus llansteffanensis]
MLLLKAVVVLALASAPPAKPAASAGCATTNIETALKHLEAHLKATAKPEKEVDPDDESGPPLAEEFMGLTWKIRDVPNGYMSTVGEAGTTYEAALFKNPEGYHLALVATGDSVVNTAAYRCDKSGLKLEKDALEVPLGTAIQLYANAGLIAPKGKPGLSQKTLRDWGGSIVAYHLPRQGRVVRLTAFVDEPDSVYGTELGILEYSHSKFRVLPPEKKKAR